jgi:hypothetical protein
MPIVLSEQRFADFSILHPQFLLTKPHFFVYFGLSTVFSHKIQHPTLPATAAYGSTPLAHSISRGVNKNTKRERYEILALFPFCVCTKFVYVVNVTVRLPLSAAKGKSS